MSYKEHIIKNLKSLLNNKEVKISSAIKLEKLADSSVLAKCEENNLYITFYTSLDMYDSKYFTELKDMVHDVMTHVKVLDGTFDEKSKVREELINSFNQILFPVGKLYLSPENIVGIEYLQNNTINILVKDHEKHINKVKIWIKPN